MGYIDYANNRIYVGEICPLDEDTVHYSSRRGTAIGGLTDNTDYIVILDHKPGYIRLALTEQNAIDKTGEDLWYDPTQGLRVTMNTKEFDGSQVDSQLTRITLDNKAFSQNDNSVDFSLLGLTFELGQAVVYHGAKTPREPVSIDELMDGQTYYVITGIDEFDLQGDNRFVQHQVIQLAETEMEARAGVNIGFKLDPADVAATGFRLEAKHVLDSGWSNGIGILSGLKAEDKASAEAGVEDEEEEGGNDQDQGKGDFSLAPEGSIFDTIVGKLAKPATKAIGGRRAGVAGQGRGRLCLLLCRP